MKETVKRLPSFDADFSEDFPLWALHFEGFVEEKEVSQVLFHDALGDRDLSELSSEEKKRIDYASALLVMCLGHKALRTFLREKKNPFNIFQNIEKRYATKSPASRVQIQTKLHNMHYDTSMSLSTYIDGMEGLFIKLEEIKSSVPESLQVAMLLASFGNLDNSPYGPVLSALNSFAEEQFTWESVTSRLLQEFESLQKGTSRKKKKWTMLTWCIHMN